MIRLVQKRLIIPRGDTGSFTIPTIAAAQGNVAVFTILDPRTRTRLAPPKILDASAPFLTVEFTHGDTVNLKPGRYLWDIKIYKNPVYSEGELVDGEEIDSYYAGYMLPECEIRETGDSLLYSDDSPTALLAPSQIDLITSALAEIATNVAKTESNVAHYPMIIGKRWYVWDANIDDYVDTGVDADGILPDMSMYLLVEDMQPLSNNEIDNIIDNV